MAGNALVTTKNYNIFYYSFKKPGSSHSKHGQDFRKFIRHCLKIIYYGFKEPGSSHTPTLVCQHDLPTLVFCLKAALHIAHL